MPKFFNMSRTSKKIRNVFPLLVAENNSYLSYYQSGCGKWDRNDFSFFNQNVPLRLAELRESLIDGTYNLGPYTFFVVYEPKERIIMKLPVRDRIAQHMWDNVINPMMDNKFYYHSYACRVNKGIHAASQQLKNWMYWKICVEGKNLYALKGDIYNYFWNVHHDILFNQFCRFVKDDQLLELTWKFISQNGQLLPNGVGIPVGNLTSQLFANVYGNILDEFVTQQLKCHMYIRYMDDMVIIADSLEYLKNLFKILSYKLSSIKLKIKNNYQFFTIAESPKAKGRAIDFMGFKFYMKKTVLRKSIMLKCSRKARRIAKEHKPKIHSIRQMLSYYGWIKHTDVKEFTKSRIDNIIDFRQYRNRMSIYDRRRIHAA